MPSGAIVISLQYVNYSLSRALPSFTDIKKSGFGLNDINHDTDPSDGLFRVLQGYLVTSVTDSGKLLDQVKMNTFFRDTQIDIAKKLTQALGGEIYLESKSVKCSSQDIINTL